MRSWIRTLGLSALLAGTAVANEAELGPDLSHRLQCSGMYSRKAWGGSVDPFILTKFAKSSPSDDRDPLVSLAIFEWADGHLIGRRASDDPEEPPSLICDEASVQAELSTGRSYMFKTVTTSVCFFARFLFGCLRSPVPVQNYITAILVFLILEQLMTWGFYVCMGYGVVKPSLGRTMVYVRILAITHFVFAVIYAIASLSITPEAAGILILFIELPLAATLTAFYVWTLSSLNATMKDLIDRKQKTKAMMYKKLWYCLLGSIIVLFGFIFINALAFASRSEEDFLPEHWKNRWFVLDGWLSIVYLADLAFIAYLWRPTANNRRFAMSDELAQDDDGFEIRSFNGALDEEDALGGLDEHSASEPRRDLSPVPPKPVPSAARTRESLDGETIFAVGEDGDKWSDDEDESPRNSTERKALTKDVD
ncbi:hypothetical protein AN0063.2 [Aspergillus nidulans FGSC A4]|uniref:Integral membrane protein (Ptm1), putative (AFU_orthologue AFUA_5G12390) n=1 Tax=Emericella nidulans (strain FGSC A4 / ATCC 38163 / CBS 112.46 / NRRL 194 / M139) TaxID=227321 RepID=Q5BHB7_EMENI|nr:hypothetical protein [Aspergillus nidulans FGSC A4]EAA65241.1 hypothetical protein AN0063.2 [Aspergillus nidulans FGSC A4]CBF90273.1 TPA: integral membrane protein (Ptm1), putative (AFU_orthologue; AFUA_5G12390) [Aspergillus nidulans FGSC A4]|eukprot:XP_657667.1 hypothetical protein AN0063.2 [Aspergillus nidulans FGSC A4]